MKNTCPLRIHDWRTDEEIPLCPVSNCMHTLLRGEKVCPCHTPLPEAGWEKEFDEKFPTKTINHHHYKRARHLKDFIHSLLEARDKELVEIIEKEKYENKNLPPYEYKTFHRAWDEALSHVIRLIEKK